MEIYRLSSLGYKLSHNIRHEDNPNWRLIHYLSKYHSASSEKLMSEVPGLTKNNLIKLRTKGILVNENEVIV